MLALPSTTAHHLPKVSPWLAGHPFHGYITIEICSGAFHGLMVGAKEVLAGDDIGDKVVS